MAIGGTKNTGVTTYVNPLYNPKGNDGGVKGVKGDKIEAIKGFDLASSKMEVGSGKNAPKTKTDWSDTVTNVFTKFGNFLLKVFTPELPPGVGQAPGLPSGVTIDAKGHIDSRIPLSLHPDALKHLGLSQDARKTDAVEYMATIAESRTAPDEDFDLPNGTTLSMNSENCRDFGRMQVIIPTGQGSFNSLHDEGQDPDDKIGETLGHLRDFAGSDEATRVLGAFTNQNTVRNIMRSLEGPDGENIMIRPAPSQGRLMVETSQGKSLVEDTSQLRNTEFKLSKTQDGNFKIDVKWTSYGQSFNTLENGKISGSPVVFGPNRGMKQTVELSLTIDAREAARGNIVVVDGDPGTVHFEGKVSVTQTKANLSKLD